ncbi:hypothetical protein O6H91_22G048900 [Diphasiastrum complanatum]|uniref:Uncharacterized protein n=1 Tax=Diphasiastrum complanatum TaxID=34168 RepID=A0ACC2AF80_DIPCM|nr:hypothetical protein O6H91_Y358500 [Diphasiastrum complanatum]KAJ7516240.1 hypothetical protein O6H91_22G048900 [Diphasiastrum complanatum]
MEDLAAAKTQILEMARAILEAKDAELAFHMQVLETMNAVLPQFSVSPNSPEPNSKKGPISALHTDDGDGLVEGMDEDRRNAIHLTILELGSLNREAADREMAIREASRFSQLDAIQEHDFEFARSLADLPQNVWEKTGDYFSDPCVPVPDMAYEVGAGPEYEQVVELAQSWFGSKSVTTPASSTRGEHFGSGMGSVLLAQNPIMRIERLEQKQGERDSLALVEIGDYLSWETKTAQTCQGPKEVVHSTSGRGEVCQICMEEKPFTSFLTIEGCQHKFCVICISKHAEARFQSGQLFVTCPYLGCLNTLTLNECSQLLPSESFRILSTRQIEAAIPETERLYCPYPDCSSLLIKPEIDMSRQSASSAHPHMSAVGCVECEACHRAFCMECAVPWHGDLTCAEYQDELKSPGTYGDKKLLELAESRNWQRCKQCARVIELKYGCNHITCLCGHQFCYLCGAAWINSRQRTCTCSLWTEDKIVSRSG